MVRNVLWLLTMVMVMYGCKEAQPAGPGIDDVTIYEVRTDVNPDNVFLVRGTNLYVLSDVGYLVCYGQGHKDIRIPMKLIFGETSFSCILPDSVRSGRVKIVDGSEKVLMDTVLRIYGSYNNELAWLPSDLVWNQGVEIKGSMMPVLVDQDMHHHALIAHPSKPGTWTIPHRTGQCRWVIYDASTLLYHAARTLVKIPRPRIGMERIGASDIVVVKDYVPLENERVRLTSARQTYEQAVYQYAGNVVVSMAGMEAGDYRAGVGSADDYQEFDGEVAIHDSLEGEKPPPSSISIGGRHVVRLQTIHVAITDDATRADTSRGTDYVSFSYALERCTLERLSKDVVRINGQEQATGSVTVSGTIVRDGDRLTTDLTFTDEGSDGIYTKRHRVRLKQRPCTVGPDGLVEVVIGDEDFVGTGEYYYDGREVASTPMLTHVWTTRVWESGGRGGNGLVLKVRL